MTNQKIILINGPPRSGKDTVGQILRLHFHATVDKFARVLKEKAHTLYGMGTLAHGAYESKKEDPLPVFLGKTPREVYIALSETYYKPLHGIDIFGKLLWQDIRNVDGIIAITDSGFEPEARYLIDQVGAENVRLIRVYRPGCDFSGDSRSYINLGPEVGTFDLVNDGTLQGLEHEVRQWMLSGAQLVS